MKSSIFPTASCLRLVFMGMAIALATGSALADNPLKFLRSKAKQGLSKVAQVVNPRRVVSVVQNVKNAAVEVIPTTRVRPTVGRDYYYYESRPPEYYYQQNTQRLEVPTRTQLYPSPRTEYYTAPSNQQPSYLSQTDSGYQGNSNAGGVPNEFHSRSRITTDPASETAPIPHKVLERNPAPQPDETPLEVVRNAPPGQKSPSGEDSSLNRKKSRTNPKVVPATQTSSDAAQSARKSAPRQDLPFGELVPGKTGFVYSPYSTKELVDVSGIPTGTKVKCPYSGKTFRVP